MTADKLRFESFEQMAEATAASLVQAAGHYAFQLFSDKEFRRLAGFELLTQVEQDRIFNELVVAHLVLLILLLEAPDLRIPGEFKDYLAGLKEKIPKAHVDYLQTLGIEAEHLGIWEKLIALRYEEYAKDRHEVRAAAMQLHSSEKDLELEDLSKIQLLVPVQSAAIGCHHHVCRGATEGHDELFKRTLKSLSRLYFEIRIRLEGGKITPLTRARLAMKRMVRRKRAKKK